jgi:hypothetical protein
VLRKPGQGNPRSVIQERYSSAVIVIFNIQEVVLAIKATYMYSTYNEKLYTPKRRKNGLNICTAVRQTRKGELTSKIQLGTKAPNEV